MRISVTAALAAIVLSNPVLSDPVLADSWQDTLEAGIQKQMPSSFGLGSKPLNGTEWRCSRSS